MLGRLRGNPYDLLRALGVSAIYGPGTNIPKAAAEVLSLIASRRVGRLATDKRSSGKGTCAE
jgi:methylmalonyl-CoA mutase cobalamin-binding subunit